MNEIRTGTWGCVLHRVPDGRLKIIFDGQANCHLVPERFIQIMLSVLLVLLSVPVFSLPTIHITISASAYPAESIPQGWSFEGVNYNSDALEAWTSGGPGGSPLISIFCTVDSLTPGVIVKSIQISLTADQALMLGVLATKTITMEILNESSKYSHPSNNDSALPVFRSVFGG